MADSWPHIILLLVGLTGWVMSATPLLIHMVFLSEKNFRWPLLGWFTSITISIFLVKLSLFGLTGWPAPVTWPSRFFYPVGLFASPLIPYLNEVRKSRKN